MSNENTFGFWDDFGNDQFQLKPYVILPQERKDFFDKLSEYIESANNDEERAMAWWKNLFCGMLKDNQGNFHNICRISTEHILPTCQTITFETIVKKKSEKNLCSLFFDPNHNDFVF